MSVSLEYKSALTLTKNLSIKENLFVRFVNIAPGMCLIEIVEISFSSLSL